MESGMIGAAQAAFVGKQASMTESINNRLLSANADLDQALGSLNVLFDRLFGPRPEPGQSGNGPRAVPAGMDGQIAESLDRLQALSSRLVNVAGELGQRI